MKSLLLICLLATSACDNLTPANTQGSNKVTDDKMTIRLNIQPDEYAQLNGLTKKSNINKQPAGLNFYTKHWSVKQYGSVRVDHGKHSFTIPHALTVMGTYDVTYPEKGLSSFYVGGGMTPHNEESHEQVHLLFMNFLQHLLDIGWRSYIYFSDPRLLPKDAVRYAFETDTGYILPANSPLSLEQWMRRTDQSWQLHANGVFLSITFMRDGETMDINEKSSYFFSYDLIDTYNLAANSVEYKDRPNAIELWPKTLQKLHGYRDETEAMLREQGIEIDTAYTDPVLILE
jgi:hypothetical protein